VGKGTFVGQPELLETNLKVVWGFTETFRAEGYKTDSQLIYFGEVLGDRVIAENLKISEDTPLYCLTRKRLLNDLPVGIETAYILREDCPGLDQFDWNKESLYRVLREQYGLDPVCGYNYIEAASADEATAHLLSIPRNFPVLATERTSCLIDLRPVEYVRAYYRADRMRLKVEMTADRPVSRLKTKIDSSNPDW
jgi:GntR family transcriptional regulator